MDNLSLATKKSHATVKSRRDFVVVHVVTYNFVV